MRKQLTDKPLVHRHTDKRRNVIINRCSTDLEKIINGHDPETGNLNNDVWDRLDKMALEIEAHLASREAQQAATPTSQEAVLREIIDWCHLQPGNYPNWMDRARQAVGDFEGDPGQPPQPSASVAEDVLDAANNYLTNQYGLSALGHPVDRQRILRALKGSGDE